MINPLDLTPEDVGREVIYTAPHGTTEQGWLTSWTETCVYARFGRGTTGQRCPAASLRFAHPCRDSEFAGDPTYDSLDETVR